MSTSDRSRAWETVLARLPLGAGERVLDLGCGAGDAAAALAARGAEVIGIDLDAARVDAARARCIPRAEFRVADLRAPLQLERPADGLWAAYTAACFPDLAPVLERWSRSLRPGGWVALVEIEDLLAHEPLSAEARDWLAGYAAEAVSAGRYDFRCGSKLERHVADAGLRLEWSCEVPDPEYAWQGPLDAPALVSWRARLERMPLMRAAAGERAGRLCEELLACLGHPEHRTRARVRACLARRSG